MTPLFGIDITENKKNETMAAERFAVKTLSAEQTDRMKETTNALDETVKATKLPIVLNVVKYVCGLFGLIVLASTLKALAEIGIEQAFQNAPILLCAGAVCLVIWAVLFLYGRHRKNAVFQERDVNFEIATLLREQASAFAQLGVPQDAATVDTLTFRYKRKDGEVVAKTIGLQTSAYLNFEVKLYEDNGAICLADIETVYAIPKEYLKSIRTVEKRISMSGWNKDEDPDSETYKPYKLALNSLGDIFFKPYYVLEFGYEGEVFGIYFPPYELAAFERVTGLRAR